MMKRDFGWDNEDLYWTLQIEIPGIVLYIREFYSKYQSCFPFLAAMLTSNWIDQLNLLLAATFKYAGLPNKCCAHGLEKYDSHSEDTFAFCGENCCSSKELTRLQESEKQLENLEFQFLNIMTIDSSEESSKTLQQLKLNTEHMQNNLCTVSNGLCCCLEPIRSLRKWLNKRCETLRAKIQFSCNEKDAGEEIFDIYVRLPDGKIASYKKFQPSMGVETLSKRTEAELLMKDFYLTLNGRIIDNNITIREERITPCSIIDVQLRLRGGTGLCCLAGCKSEAGGHLLTSCKGSYEINEEHDSFNVCHEHFMWDQQNHGACGEPEIKYIPCSLCQKLIKCLRPYGCSKHTSVYLDKTFHVTCNSGESASYTDDNQSVYLEQNFICFSCSQGLKQQTVQNASNPKGDQVLSKGVFDPKNIGQLFASLINRLPQNWSFSITGDETIRLSFCPVREGKQNANERQILITRTGTLSVELLNQKVHWHEGQIQAGESEQLVDNILRVMRKVEMIKICCGIYDGEIRSYAKERLSTTTCNFIVDSQWAIPLPITGKIIRETVRSSDQCLVITKNTGRSERCANCQKLLNNSLRFKSNAKTTNETKANSRVKLSLLTNETLLERARNMSKEIKKLREKNWNLRKLLKKKTEIRVNNFNPSSDALTQMVQFAVQNNILKKESLLYTFMQDAVTQLNLMHNPSKKQGNNAKPKGMRWDALTIKFAVTLAVKCKAKGYEAIRKWLPLPSWRIVQGYRQADMDVTLIDMNNLKLCWQEINNKEVKGVFGLHWDEMEIRDGIRQCRRTGKLVGFEDLSIPKEYERETEAQYDDSEEYSVTASDSEQHTPIDTTKEEEEEEYLDEEDTYYEDA